MSLPRALLLLSLTAPSACRHPATPTDSPTDSPATTDTPSLPTGTTPITTPTEIEALEAQGFLVGEGAFVFSDMSGCCDPGAYCWGNNPSTPYGTPLVPLAPGETADAAVDLLSGFGPVPPGLVRTFHLRADEAIVTFGTMPPSSAYFSFRSYLGARDGVIIPITGSLGASLNNLVIEAERGAPIWEQPIAIVTSFDASIEERVRAGLVAAGWDPLDIHADRIASDVVRPGLSPESDTFFALVRSGVYDDPVAGLAYREAPDLRVLRLTPPAEEPWAAPWPWPYLPPRGTGVAEDDALRDARDRVIDAISTTYADRSPTTSVPVPYWFETLECVQDEVNCAGDIRDRFTAVGDGYTLAAGEALIAVGVNHARAGKALYSSISVQSIVAQRGIASLESPDMPGSAAAWMPGDPLADDLYTWTIARDCTGMPTPCFALPTECPGVVEDEAFKITVRAYLEPTTGAAPVGPELIGDTLVKLSAPP